jgi:hypothetical protein
VKNQEVERFTNHLLMDGRLSRLVHHLQEGVSQVMALVDYHVGYKMGICHQKQFD